MGNPEQAISNAFAASLTTYATSAGLSIAWPNVQFAPTPGTPYLQVDLVPGEPYQAELGALGQNLHLGFYQITLVYPSGTGTLAPGTIRDAIINHFKRGTILTSGSVSVSITRSYSSVMLQAADWVHIPITIKYRTFASN